MTKMYIGPSKAYLSALQDRTLFDGLPEWLEKLIGDHPTLNTLLVSPENLGAALVALKNSGSAISLAYKKVAEESKALRVTLRG